MNEQQTVVIQPKLYMLLLGSKAPGRHVEQHDFFFGIAHSLKELVPQIKAFWRNTGTSLHIDGWREVNAVDGYRINVVPKQDTEGSPADKLFFINLGGYQPNKLEEQHYVVLTVQPDRALAIQQSKKSVFFRTNTIAGMKGANAHIDDKYGIDVDDIYRIEEMLSPELKDLYQIQITPADNLTEDEVHLGYFRLDKLT
ncbi:DUF1543 domain-containing protein [Mucilaginibacter phyllosphaerae]|uniref:DUF1543 domain-containing protein n=1 Tax=Mucilaginibacter phyllosphaerae TaxID=1812349 RepID=A0A4Y8AK84_9SPHI|nr:DUF1543 domain-containing protein [Mucilaginibacter phyllosphaerae]MBB3967521.1 hypothetical protein [Mucilaginibacter phyllosphaerae]TEW69417.1 DUF1543 domain-containing protein [Mucilaginibacter phyllosphaerae]GGH21189.1 hypothetical protein GCM10007352_33710 [Mucilaginibacter phyllosphaerae]